MPPAAGAPPRTPPGEIISPVGLAPAQADSLHFRKRTFKIELLSNSISNAKLRPSSFALSAAAGTRSRLASRNASHFGATSCRALPIPDKIMTILIWNWNNAKIYVFLSTQTLFRAGSPIFFFQHVKKDLTL
jgi:hypothetical protein